MARKRWAPSDVVGNKELVGRRIFDDPIFNGELDQAARGKLRFDHFMETREDGELSLDRLGRSNAEKRVLTYLQPRCDHAGARFQRQRNFEGWAGFQVQQIRQNKNLSLSVEASPIRSDSPTDNDIEDNDYHSHILIPSNLGKHPEYLVALHLKHLFDRFGKLVSHSSSLYGGGLAKSLKSICCQLLAKIMPSSDWNRSR